MNSKTDIRVGDRFKSIHHGTIVEIVGRVVTDEGWETRYVSGPIPNDWDRDASFESGYNYSRYAPVYEPGAENNQKDTPAFRPEGV